MHRFVTLAFYSTRAGTRYTFNVATPVKEITGSLSREFDHERPGDGAVKAWMISKFPHWQTVAAR